MFFILIVVVVSQVRITVRSYLIVYFICVRFIYINYALTKSFKKKTQSRTQRYVNVNNGYFCPDEVVESDRISHSSREAQEKLVKIELMYDRLESQGAHNLDRLSLPHSQPNMYV